MISFFCHNKKLVNYWLFHFNKWRIRKQENKKQKSKRQSHLQYIFTKILPPSYLHDIREIARVKPGAKGAPLRCARNDKMARVNRIAT